jgi:hypothetical protein
MDPQAFDAGIAEAFAAAAQLSRPLPPRRAGIFEVQPSGADAGLAEHYLQALLPPGPTREALPLHVLGPADLDLHALLPRPLEHGRMHDGKRYWLLWSGSESPVLLAYDREGRRGLAWLAQGSAPPWELSRPACALLNQAALEGPCTLVHGAAVGREGRMLLLVGPGRAGKSSAALACAHAGWDYAGDDYVMADSQSGEVLPLFASARLREDMAGHFAGLLRAARRATSGNGGEIRHELDLARVLDPAALRGGRVAAILVPRRRGAAGVEFTAANRSDAFHAAFAATFQGAPGPLSGHARKLAALVATAPVHFVDTGPDPAAIPQAFARFLDALSPATSPG